MCYLLHMVHRMRLQHTHNTHVHTCFLNADGIALVESVPRELTVDVDYLPSHPKTSHILSCASLCKQPIKVDILKHLLLPVYV